MSEPDLTPERLASLLRRFENGEYSARIQPMTHAALITALCMARRTADAERRIEGLASARLCAEFARVDRERAELERQLAEAKAAMAELLAATDVELTTHPGLAVSRIMRIGSARRAARAALDAPPSDSEET